MNLEQELKNSLEASFINYEKKANEKLKTKFVENDQLTKTNVLDSVLTELSSCTYFRFNVAFITSSGLICLKNTLRTLEKKGVKGEIITGGYLFFNDPKALKDLIRFSNITVKFIDESALHAKCYIFEHKDYQTVILGSANLTSSALKENKEWNIKISSLNNGEIIKSTLDSFKTLFNQGEILNEEKIEKYEYFYNKYHKENPIKSLVRKVKPNLMQSEALINLKKLRDEGKTKALLISATGTGKTYLSAFDVKNYNPKKMLFLVHKENILESALKTFKNVIGEEKTYGILSGTRKDLTADFLFSTVQSMTKDKTLNLFDKSEFDYLIIDEAHHTEAESYKKIIEYFNPCFTLGMTATPERNDNGDIFKIFDNNIAYEIRLEKALSQKMLVPFHYFGVSDIITIEKDEKGRDIMPDFNQLTSLDRVEHIISNLEFFGYSGSRPRGLIFCSNQDEAIELSRLFNQKGYKTRAVVSKENNVISYRLESVELLESESSTNYLDYLFVVDIFNEGVDIPSLNQIVMLRKTESAIIYIQQLGRVLRKYENKEYAVVIDFISNYDNNFLIPIALLGDKSFNKDTITRKFMEGSNALLGSSTIEFDQISKDRIFESLRNEKKLSNSKIIKKEYFNLKNKLGRIPTLMDFYYSDTIDPYVLLDSFSNYHSLIKKIDKTNKHTITKNEDLMLSYFNTVLAKGITTEEVLILKELIINGVTDKETIKKRVISSSNINRFDRALKRVNFNFLVGTGASKYKNSRLFVEEKFGLIRLYDTNFKKDEYFKKMLLDYIELALRNNKDNYSSTYLGTNLVLYNKYTRLESAYAFDFKKDYTSTVFGYKIYKNEGICPIFITYNKDESMIQEVLYDDYLISNSLLCWYTRPGITTESSEIINFLNPSIKKHIFVKKDTNSKSFYYLGTATVQDYKNEVIDGNKFVKFILKFDISIREDVYNYLSHKSEVFV